MGLAEDVDLSKYSIEIEAYPDRFVIRDDSGGMTLDEAANYAFSFGRKPSDEPDEYSIGVYGIGMKRAVFKLGSEIRVRSTFDDGSGNELAFAVPIDVPSWLSDNAPLWDFDIVEDDPLENNGVEIVVKVLTTGAKSSFESPAFLQNLRRTIARDYSLHLNRGLTISLNGKPIPGWKIELRQSDDFVPIRVEYQDAVDGDEVAIEVIGGMAALPPESNEPDEADDGDRRFGWYIICNGRIVLAADKTSVSGWGTEDWPQWHRQYSGFMGIILFTAAKATALPLTTTKRSVDQSSEIFRRARPQMRDVTRKWIAYTNQRKQALEEAREIEAKAAPVPIYQLRREVPLQFPKLTQRPLERVANVHYSVPIAKMKRLAKELGSINLTYREVGIRTFDYTYDDMVGDD